MSYNIRLLAQVAAIASGQPKIVIKFNKIQVAEWLPYAANWQANAVRSFSHITPR